MRTKVRSSEELLASEHPVNETQCSFPTHEVLTHVVSKKDNQMPVIEKIAKTSDQMLDNMFDAAEKNTDRVHAYSRTAMDATFNLLTAGISANRAVADKVLGRFMPAEEVAPVAPAKKTPARKPATKPAAKKAPARKAAAKRKPAAKK